MASGAHVVTLKVLVSLLFPFYAEILHGKHAVLIYPKLKHRSIKNLIVMDARIFCKRRTEEGHREKHCFVLPFFSLFPFFFPTFWFHIVKVVQDGSSNGQTMRLELPTQNGHAYVPKHSTGPRTGPRAAAGCQDAGPPQDLGPPPGCPSPAPSQQLAVSCLSPLDNFSRRIHILFAVFDLAFRNFPALSRPTSTPSKGSYQLSKRQFRLQMLLTGSEGRAAVHQPPDVFLLSLPFSFILLHCSNRGQELKQTSLIPAPAILLLLRKATVEAEMERSTAGSWRSTFSVLQTRWGGNVWRCAAGKSTDGERMFPNLCLLCSTYMMQSQPFHKHIFRL